VYDYICRLSYELKPGFQPYARTHATQATYATYHVTNSSHVIGHFLRYLRKLEHVLFLLRGVFSTLRCLCCVS